MRALRSKYLQVNPEEIFFKNNEPITISPNSFIIYSSDIANYELKEITNKFGTLVILVNGAGINAATPFFDIKVVNFCKSLRSEFKLRNGKSRFVLRNSIKNLSNSVSISPNRFALFSYFKFN